MAAGIVGGEMGTRELCGVGTDSGVLPQMVGIRNDRWEQGIKSGGSCRRQPEIADDGAGTRMKYE